MRFSTCLLALGTITPVVYAQTAGQTRAREIQACANTIDMISYDSPVSYTIDDTTLYDATFTYDPAKCNPSTPIPISRPTLQNLDTMTTVTCTAVSFGTSGKLFTQCSKSHGQMAKEAQGVDGGDPAPNQSIMLSLGRSPTYYTIRNDFEVEVLPPPPVPSGMKRSIMGRRATPFICLPGESYCWTGEGRTFGCVATSTDASACGACPLSEDAQDCASIPGVDNVDCRAGKCVVNSCMSGYQVSTDRKSCIKWDSRKRGIRFRPRPQSRSSF